MEATLKSIEEKLEERLVDEKTSIKLFQIKPTPFKINKLK